MDPIVLSRLAPAWSDELSGAVFAGVRAWTGGFGLVFDRAPAGGRPGRRLVLIVRVAPPVWLWLADPQPDDSTRGADRRAGDWAYRPPAGTIVTAIAAPTMDRRIVVECSGPAGDPLRAHVELWPPGNLIVHGSHARILWCARTRPPSTYRTAIAAGLTYAPPHAAALRDPAALDPIELEGWLGQTAPERWPLVLSRQVAGLPKGALEALLPTLPQAVQGGHDWPALAAALAAWARAMFGNAPVYGVTWRAPSPGALLVTRRLDGGVSGSIDTHGPFDSWPAAAAGIAKTLPAPVDADAHAAARARLRRLERAEAAVLADLTEAERAEEVRAQANALAAFLPRVPKGATRVSLPDPAESARTLEIDLDPRQKPHENADRLFKRAGKLERTRAQAPARLAEVRHQILRTRSAIEAIEAGASPAGTADDPGGGPARAEGARRTRAPGPRATRAGGGARRRDPGPASHEPRRYRTAEGWEVWIGRNNQGNDHLTHRLARPEDYWLHVHGAAGSHVVLRRGKGPNEPSRATLEEVAGWAAFFSQARNAGTVPITVTQKKYVRKPRKAPAGLAEVMRSKTVFARPKEPPDTARLEEPDP